MKTNSRRFRVGVILPVVIAASILMASCFTTVEATRKKTFVISTNPPGADVSSSRKSYWKVIGTTPLAYRTEVPIIKKHFPGEYWLWLLAPLAFTAVGNAMVNWDFSLSTPDSEVSRSTAGAVLGWFVGPVSFTTLLFWFLTDEIIAACDDGTEVAGNHETLSFAKDGYEDSSATLQFGPGNKEIKLDLRPAWYLRYGLKSAKDLELPQSVPLLKAALEDDSPKVRTAATQKLETLVSAVGATEVAPDLQKLLNDKDPGVSSAASKALEDLKAFENQPPITVGAEPPEGYEKFSAKKDTAGKLIKHGEYKSWFGVGKLASEGQYLGGFKQGKWIFYYPEGGKRLESEYQNDKKTGLWTTWSQDGRSATTVEYRDDVEVPAARSSKLP